MTPRTKNVYLNPARRVIASVELLSVLNSKVTKIGLESKNYTSAYHGRISNDIFVP